jgi:hypothetical protein
MSKIKNWSKVVIVPSNYDSLPKKKYLIALAAKGTGFNCRTTLASGTDKDDAISIARHRFPHDRIGDIKEVDY